MNDYIYISRIDKSKGRHDEQTYVVNEENYKQKIAFNFYV